MEVQESPSELMDRLLSKSIFKKRHEIREEERNKAEGPAREMWDESRAENPVDNKKELMELEMGSIVLRIMRAEIMSTFYRRLLSLRAVLAILAVHLP